MIIYAIKNRTTVVIALIISHLITALFFGLLVFDYDSFKEIVLGLIIYSIVTLFLVSNYDDILFEDDDFAKFSYSLTTISKILLISFAVVTVFFVSFAVVKNIAKISEFSFEKKLTRQEEFIKNPMILSSHPAHIAVKKFYLGKKLDDKWSKRGHNISVANERRKALLKDKLQDIFLLKRSSDMLLILSAMIACSLLLSRKEINQ